MAEKGVREVVSDPLAFNAREILPDRSLATVGVRNPGQTGGSADYARNAGFSLQSLGVLADAVTGVASAAKDDAITEGKIQYLQGATEAEIRQSGNMYTQQGYETLNSVEKANNWYLSETSNMDELAQLSPEQYKARLLERRKQELGSLPDDPAVRKVYVAAFEDTGPRLAAEHMKAHNSYLEQKGISSLSGALASASGANPDATRVMPGSSLRVSPSVVDTVVQGSDADKEYAVLTMLGEANGEGDVGLAAVAHVIKNRVNDPRWGGSIKDVVLAPKQFSTWNSGAGGNNPGRFRGSAAYKKAEAIYDAVMSGHTVDPTNGATHYYSPRGMQALVAEGSQSNLLPKWLDAEAAKGKTVIGGHVFVGKASGAGRVAAAVEGQSPAGTRPVPTSAEYEALGLGAYANEGRDRRNFGGAPAPEIVTTDAANPQEVAGAEGIPTAPVQNSTMVRKLVENSNLKPAAKATAVADSMRRLLDDGTDQLYNDLGGTSILYALGATPAEIDEVTKAYARFEKKELDKFDINVEREMSDVVMKTKEGQFNTRDEALQAVADLHERKRITDAQARSLFRQVETAWSKTGVQTVIPPEARADVQKLYRRIADGDLDPTAAGHEVVAIGKQYGLEPNDVNSFIGQMFSEDKAREDRDRTRVEAEFKKVQKEQTVKDAVQAAIANDQPIDGIDGTIRVKNDQGNEIEVNAKDYAVRLVKDSETKNIKDLVQAGKMDAESAPANLNKTVYEKLAKIGLVDEEHGREMASALRGNIAPKGQLTEDARMAFDEYLQMVQNPNIGPDYLAKMIPDNYVRSLLKTAELNYAGRFGIDDALLKAHEQLQRRDFNPEERIQMTSTYYAVRDKGIGEEIDKAIARPGWFGGYATRPSEVEALNDKSGPAYKAMQQFVEAQANIYHVNMPQEDPEVSIKKAVEDLGRNMIIVSGNPVIGRTDRQQRLDQVMGLEGQDKTLPQQAIDRTIQRLGPAVWGQIWEDLKPKDLGLFTPKEDRTPIGQAGLIAPDKQITPPYYATYNPSTGIIGIQLWNKDKTALVGNPMYINARASGARFKEELRTPSAFSNMVRSTKEAIVDLSQQVDLTTGLNEQGLPQ